jgi:hypothetical protein
MKELREKLLTDREARDSESLITTASERYDGPDDLSIWSP